MRSQVEEVRGAGCGEELLRRKVCLGGVEVVGGADVEPVAVILKPGVDVMCFCKVQIESCHGVDAVTHVFKNFRIDDMPA